MNIKQFEDYLRKQVLAERKAYLESRESSPETKDLNILDEGVMDAIASFIGRSERAQSFFAGRYLSYMGVPTSSKLYAPFKGYFKMIEKEQLQKLFNGEEKAREHFAEFATLLTLKVLQDDFINIFGLTEKTHIGGALLDAIQSAIDSDSFKETVRESIYDSLLNVSKDNFSDVDKKLDVDGDGLSAAEEEVIGSDDNDPDNTSSIKDKIEPEEAEAESAEVPVKPEEVSAEQTPEEDKKQSDSVKKKISKRKKTKKKKAEPDSQMGLFGEKPKKDSPPSKEEEAEEEEEEKEQPQQQSLFEESSLISSELLKRILDQ